MGKKEEILAYCATRNEKITAQEILAALYPGKPQPYINSTIVELVYEGKLIREDTRPYTVHVPQPGETVGAIQDYSRETRHHNSPDIPTPCTAEVEKYLQQWSGLENYTLQEKALNKLFLETYPDNVQIEDVLVKVATLNDFYSTNIFSVYPVAKHIVNLKLDERLRSGDLTLVQDIATVTMEDGSQKHFYSFATKYCSHHEPDKYVIYDSYVEKVLKHFLNRKDLKDYESFMTAIREFQEKYSLQQYSLKEIDRYLWLLGKEWYPKKYM